MLDRAADLLGSLKSARDVDAIWMSLRRFSASYGMDSLTLAALRLDPVQRALVPIQYRTDLPAKPFRDFFEGGRFRRDPVFWAAQQAERPLPTHLDRYRGLPMSQGIREIFEDEMVQASSFRLTMPIVTSPGGYRWSVFFGGEHTLQDAAGIARDAGPALWLAASAASLRLLELTQLRAPTENPLSRREQECLLRLAQGLRLDRIADRLGLSTATVDMHLANARQKLGARTSPEAVARAVQAGFINP